jgi:hypothetical protein
MSFLPLYLFYLFLIAQSAAFPGFGGNRGLFPEGFRRKLKR